MAKDFYAILHVSRDASGSEIKKAYKQLCRKYHPDFSPDAAPADFLDIQEAFRVLSHPQRRRHYDYHLDSEEDRRQPEEKPEHEPVSLFKDFIHFIPSLEEIYEGFMAGYRGVSPKSSTHRDLHVEITLQREEARWGGTFSLEVPVPVSCPRCHGTGKRETLTCGTCDGKGKIPRKRRILITYPASTQDNSVFQYNLDEYQIPGIVLHVHFRIM